MSDTHRTGAMPEPTDCRVINGDRAVIISQSTAEYALQAMREKLAAGGWKLMADDASFVGAGIEELEKAVKVGR